MVFVLRWELSFSEEREDNRLNTVHGHTISDAVDVTSQKKHVVFEENVISRLCFAFDTSIGLFAQLFTI